MAIPASGFPLTIFCGKGGVGKTTIALAFALRHATAGRRVLVITSHPLPELAVSISLAGLKDAFPQAAANLFIIHIDPMEIIAGKVQGVIRSEMLLKRVLASPIYKSLIEIAPGLKEIAFLGRLHQLTEERARQDRPGNFDLVLWDAPATGHFLQTLKVSQSFEIYLSGPFGLLGKEVAEFFAEASNVALIPVTTLEEMAVEETTELCQKLDAELQIRPSAVVCNLASPLLGSPDFDPEKLRGEIDEEGAAGPRLKEELNFILDRHAIERALFRKLRNSLAGEFHIVRRMPNWNSDLELLTECSRQLGGILKD